MSHVPTRKDFSLAGSRFGEVFVGLSIISARFRLRVTSENMEEFEPGGIRTLDISIVELSWHSTQSDCDTLPLICRVHVSQSISELDSIENVHLPADIRRPILWLRWSRKTARTFGDQDVMDHVTPVDKGSDLMLSDLQYRLPNWDTCCAR
jgi:hypothetical protein